MAWCRTNTDRHFLKSLPLCSACLFSKRFSIYFLLWGGCRNETTNDIDGIL